MEDSSTGADEARFQTVATTAEIPTGQGRSFPVAGHQIAIFEHNGHYYAANDFCPHMGAPMSEGYIDTDGGVVCPWHAWKFHLKDGCWMDNPTSKIRMQCYALRVVGDEIQVAIPPSTPVPPRE